MSSRKQLLVLSTTVPLLMFGATIGVAAPKDFSICTHLQGTGAGYGLCRAGVAVGCVDRTGNAQACANIEDHFLTVTNESAPWVCPCDFDDVSMASPPSGPWGGDGIEIGCQRNVDYDEKFTQVVYDKDYSTGETELLAGDHIVFGAFCTVIVDGIYYPDNSFTDLEPEEKSGCLLDLDHYWEGLRTSESIVGQFPSEICIVSSDT